MGVGVGVGVPGAIIITLVEAVLTHPGGRPKTFTLATSVPVL